MWHNFAQYLGMRFSEAQLYMTLIDITCLKTHQGLIRPTQSKAMLALLTTKFSKSGPNTRVDCARGGPAY